jgi:hypothetical protein
VMFRGHDTDYLKIFLLPFAARPHAAPLLED